MNILPKKRWHVRTKENIARVRKDEAEAAEKERQENIRIETADREARLKILKDKSKQKFIDSGFEAPQKHENDVSEHINLFADLHSATTSRNKEHDEELKEKKEEYEKKIGYLTYLGQDTNEALKKKNWYDVPPDTSRFSGSSQIRDTYDKLVLKDEDGRPKIKKLDEKDGEVGWKSKQEHDPINVIKKYIHEKKNVKPSSKKSEPSINSSKYKNRNSKEDSRNKLLKLREARLKREQEEKYKTELFLTKLSGKSNGINDGYIAKEDNRVKPKYNSQFNPELARQNFK